MPTLTEFMKSKEVLSLHAGAAGVDPFASRFKANGDGYKCKGCGAMVSSRGAAVRHLKGCSGTMGSRMRAAVLTTKERKAIPKKKFGLPGQGKYPMPDINHARNALSRAAQNASPSEQATIKRKAYKLFPQLKERAKKRGDIDKAMGGNLCRRATYQRIRAAIHLAAGALA